MLDNGVLDARPDRSSDARGPPLAADASRASHAGARETHFDTDPWTAAGVSRATWYRRSRPEPEPATPKDISRWYVARTHHGQTDLADREIRLAGFDVFAPTVFRAAIPPRRGPTGVMRPGKPDRVEFLFVRYVIVSLNLSDPNWREILDCDGVERVISGGHLQNGGVGVPIAMPDSAVAWIRELLGPNGCIDPRVHHEKPIEAGTELRLLDGPMLDRVGVCEMSDGARVVLLMNILGRSVPVTVAQSSVETA